MVFFVVDALVFLLLGSLEVAAVDQWLGDTDKHIQYTPSEQRPKDSCTNVTDPDCEGRWWGVGDDATFHLAYVRTWGKGTSMKLPFQGSGITVIGIYDVDGARAFATVDDAHEASLDFTSSAGRQLNQTVYAVDGLATDVSHVLSVWYDDTSYGDASAGRRYVNLDAFIVSFPDTILSSFPDPSHPLPTGTTSSLFLLKVLRMVPLQQSLSP
ncbi:hypothetical protein EXIGLDRAFT_773407 [Exidia glandulosa HHB12029]|uniref:Uncharacterized protein n=1 Tax=Exidia glandulosa HHB12029 TaxID=1314781 RepID=A0A166A1E3_EXIGL|nr:hypothetical protein EXIGLDRAFT_773407 [Exidia glandulosa HHB12029]